MSLTRTTRRARSAPPVRAAAPGTGPRTSSRTSRGMRRTSLRRRRPATPRSHPTRDRSWLSPSTAPLQVPVARIESRCGIAMTWVGAGRCFLRRSERPRTSTAGSCSTVPRPPRSWPAGRCSRSLRACCPRTSATRSPGAAPAPTVGPCGGRPRLCAACLPAPRHGGCPSGCVGATRRPRASPASRSPARLGRRGRIPPKECRVGEQRPHVVQFRLAVAAQHVADRAASTSWRPG